MSSVNEELKADDNLNFSENEKETDEFDDNFDNFNDNNDDEFDDNFVDAGNNSDDEFGDFDDFEESQVPEFEIQPKAPTEAELYSKVLETRPLELEQFMSSYLERLWNNTHASDEQNFNEAAILNSTCSQDLWSKLSRDTVFYNPVTGAVGQFQWTRSETNKSYLNALGVTFSHEEKPSIITTAHKKRQSNQGIRTIATPPLSPIEKPSLQTTHTRSASVSSGLKVVTPKMDESAREAKKEAEQELELDIDIARAYCELTEDTIRIFPDVKLNAMVTELTRLQKQAGEYLEGLLDQREKLKMDAETYNDLISCIVGHAQRLHVHSKDGSPAMVTKTKKSGGSFLRRKTVNVTTQSASMGGGVVGLKKQAPKPNKTLSTTNTPALITSDTRRSM